MDSDKPDVFKEAIQLYTSRMQQLISERELPLTPWELKLKHEESKLEAVEFLKDKLGLEANGREIESDINQIYDSFVEENQRDRRKCLINAALGHSNYTVCRH